MSMINGVSLGKIVGRNTSLMLGQRDVRAGGEWASSRKSEPYPVRFTVRAACSVARAKW